MPRHSWWKPAAAAVLVMAIAPVVRADDAPPVEPQPPAVRRVQVHTEATADDKTRQTKVRVVVVGQDGQPRVMTFDGLKLRNGLLASPPGSVGEIHIVSDPSASTSTVYLNPGVGDAFIGLVLDDDTDALRAQLKLGDVGVAVKEVMADSPAAKASVQKHDIVLQAGDTEVKSPKDLQTAVKEAGEENLSLTLLRAGEKMEVVVTPAKRPVPDAAAVATNLDELKTMWLSRIGPGVVLNGIPTFQPPVASPPVAYVVPPAVEELQKQVDELARQVESLQKKVEELSPR